MQNEAMRRRGAWPSAGPSVTIRYLLDQSKRIGILKVSLRYCSRDRFRNKRGKHQLLETVRDQTRRHPRRILLIEAIPSIEGPSTTHTPKADRPGGGPPLAFSGWAPVRLQSEIRCAATEIAAKSNAAARCRRSARVDACWAGRRSAAAAG